MDPEVEEQALAEEAMAEMMGFSSFGSQNRPQKKRKYNPNADASADIDGEYGVEEATTGSNSMPLGQSKRVAQSAAANDDEIDLDDGEPGDDADPAAQAEDLEEQDRPALVRPPGLPARPAPGIGPVGFGDGGVRGRPAGQANDGAGQRRWDEGAYDSSSNQNPWERLEKAMGLQPKGTWISWVPRTAQAAAPA